MVVQSEQGAELLHQVRGSIDVARNMIERSTGLYGKQDLATQAHVLAGLTDAADALSAVAAALDEELRKRTSLGPAA
jgi:hypothetical protein